MTSVAMSRDYSLGEEVTHAISHGVAAVAAIVGLVFLVMKAAAVGGALEITAVALYAGCMIFMFTASTLYHSLFQTKARDFFKMLDHSAIYFKIAGTYTPFALVTLPISLGAWVAAGAWSAALLGTVLKARAYVKKSAKNFSPVSLGLYLAMGWAAVLMMGELSDRLPGAAIWWIIAGGLAYTLGAIFYALKKVPYTHAVWHLFVVAGAACHFIAIYLYVI
ncbi:MULTISPECIES: PAQR family membrane homeostasis protein TrhA [Kordiimonas]|uniref:PAQR family membrane homeostasis protein TrhA n=1 Tax=Kordiimonas TaxID=288021 RepID=UPI00257DF926|nr:hemolysin III family protein [Kordiimonas sp. UBA4487]